MKGFATLTIVYAIAGVFVIALAAGLVSSYNSGQKAKAELSTCKEKNTALNGLIDRQNKAVDDFKAASEIAKARATKAIQGARIALAASKAERDRLGGLMGGTCDGAVVEVRKGLK